MTHPKNQTKPTKSPATKKSETAKPKSPSFSTKFFVIGMLVLFMVTALVAVSFVQLVPGHLRNPEVAHHHFRMQLFVDGEYIDFSQPQFQEDYADGVCDGLTETPIHFHDGVDQYVHIHWVGITGGEVLKYYGLNRIGGPDGVLGYRFDTGFFDSIEVLTDELPQTADPMWVYQIKDGEPVLRDQREFLREDLETFFGVKSSLTLQREEVEREEAFYNKASITTSAHDENMHMELDGEVDEDKLKELNDVLGDVIIFIQEEEPSEQAVSDRLDDFVDLPKSTCSG